jgi:hypothetical protein
MPTRRHAHALQVSALKNLGLNIRKAKVVSESGRKVNTFFITDAETSEKVVRSARLEEIRMTIINNMLYFHPVRPHSPTRPPTLLTSSLLPVLSALMVMLAA